MDEKTKPKEKEKIEKFTEKKAAKKLPKEKTEKIKETKQKAKKEIVKKEPEKTKEKEFDPWSILRYPHLTEKSMKSVEIDNKLVFIVDRRATKDLIALAVEKEFNVTVVNVNTEITTKGLKKAYVKLSGQYSASDIATRLGMV